MRAKAYWSLMRVCSGLGEGEPECRRVIRNVHQVAQTARKFLYAMVDRMGLRGQRKPGQMAKRW